MRRTRFRGGLPHRDGGWWPLCWSGFLPLPPHGTSGPARRVAHHDRRLDRLRRLARAVGVFGLFRTLWKLVRGLLSVTSVLVWTF